MGRLSEIREYKLGRVHAFFSIVEIVGIALFLIFVVAMAVLIYG